MSAKTFYRSILAACTLAACAPAALAQDASATLKIGLSSEPTSMLWRTRTFETWSRTRTTARTSPARPQARAPVTPRSPARRGR